MRPKRSPIRLPTTTEPDRRGYGCPVQWLRTRNLIKTNGYEETDPTVDPASGNGPRAGRSAAERLCPRHAPRARAIRHPTGRHPAALWRRRPQARQPHRENHLRRRHPHGRNLGLLAHLYVRRTGPRRESRIQRRRNRIPLQGKRLPARMDERELRRGRHGRRAHRGSGRQAELPPRGRPRQLARAAFRRRNHRAADRLFRCEHTRIGRLAASDRKKEHKHRGNGNGHYPVHRLGRDARTHGLAPQPRRRAAVLHRQQAPAGPVRCNDGRYGAVQHRKHMAFGGDAGARRIGGRIRLDGLPRTRIAAGRPTG